MYEYAITFDNDDIFKVAERFNAPVKAVQISKGDGSELPLEKSYLEINDVVVSAVKKATDSNDTVIRMFNPTDETKYISLNGKALNLNEDEIKDFDGKIGPWKIVSVKI